METKTRGGDAGDFCLVLTPTLTAARRASEAIRKHFSILAEDICRDLAALVADLVQSSVDLRTRRPITVTVALGADAIRGEVADERDVIPFEIALGVPA